MAARQIRHLKRFEKFVKNKNLVSKSQDYNRSLLLRKWQIPDHIRVSFVQSKPVDLRSFCYEVQDMLGSRFFERSPVYISPISGDNAIAGSSPNSRFIASLGNLELIIGCGHNWIYRFDLEQYPHDLKDLFYSQAHVYHKKFLTDIILPRKTLLLTENVTQVERTEKGFVKTRVNYLLDAFVIGGEYMFAPETSIKDTNDDGELNSFCWRHQQIELLLNALHTTPLRMYKMLSLVRAKRVQDVCSAELKNMIKIGNNQFAPLNGFRIVNVF
ncbi:hypothetical protein GJ496_003081 [Pomphorhynchus laevis]|nr:hypothetical protein GJ496_003081 [Pomphorhynchus laevis]